MVFCNFHLKSVYVINEKAAEIFEGMMAGQR